MTAIALPPCPSALVEGGRPRFGLWRGTLGDASFGSLRAPFQRGRVARKLIEKKWVYTLISSPELFLCMAIIDAGALHSFFLGLFDRKAKTMLADANGVLPGLGFARVDEQPGKLFARIGSPGAKASIEGQGAAAQVHARVGETAVDVRLDSAGEPAMSACADLGDGRFDFTQKRAGLSATGTIAHRGRTFRLDGAHAGALAGLDFTHGYLRRETRWRWAFGMGEAGGRRLAFNFSEGLLQAGSENILFLDGEPLSVGPLRFSFDPKDPRAPWTVRSPDRTIDLELTPEGHRAQNVWTPLMSSRYVQPFGVFRGRVTTPAGAPLLLENLPGVTEDHAARW